MQNLITREPSDILKYIQDRTYKISNIYILKNKFGLIILI